MICYFFYKELKIIIKHWDLFVSLAAKRFFVWFTSPKHIFIQISEQIKKYILSGYLKEGDVLPSIRVLAKELQISVITIKNAYEELEKELIEIITHITSDLDKIADYITFIDRGERPCLKCQTCQLKHCKWKDCYS